MADPQWELVVLVERILLSGFLLVIPDHRQLLRIVIAMLLTTMSAILTLLTMPYRRLPHNYYSVASHVALQCLFLGGLLVKFRADVTQMLLALGSDPSLADNVVGFSSSDNIVSLMIGFIIAALVAIVLVVARQLREEQNIPVILCVGARPTLELGEELNWHLVRGSGPSPPCPS